VAQGEQEDQSIQLAHGIVIAPTSGLRSSPMPKAHRHIHIEEQQVFANLGEAEEGDQRRWVLDTGATNHMIGSREICTELDSQVCGTVRFGDGSVTTIEGQEPIILTCKDGGHRTLTGVYFILRLKASIISLRQLDETGYHIDIRHGVMFIFDSDSQLLMKVTRDQSHLYYLELHVDQPVCLPAWCNEMVWLWHGRFVHLNFGALRRLVTHGMARGLLTLDQVEQVCDSYLVRKQR
jgi:hypothetical protein